MADILIRDVEMPRDASLWLLIRPDGKVHKLKVGGKYGEPQQGVAVPLPKGHGRLIDADALIQKMDKMAESERNKVVTTTWANAFVEIAEIVWNASTVIESEMEGSSKK